MLYPVIFSCITIMNCNHPTTSCCIFGVQSIFPSPFCSTLAYALLICPFEASDLADAVLPPENKHQEVGEEIPATTSTMA